MPVRVLVTEGTTADCRKAIELIDGLRAEHLLADRGYDTDAIIDFAKNSGIKPEISPKKNRIEQREYDSHLYKIRYLVEIAFNEIKRWRGVATRYAKRESSFLSIVQIACLWLWLKISRRHYLALEFTSLRHEFTLIFATSLCFAFAITFVASAYRFTLPRLLVSR